MAIEVGTIVRIVGGRLDGKRGEVERIQTYPSLGITDRYLVNHGEVAPVWLEAHQMEVVDGRS